MAVTFTGRTGFVVSNATFTNPTTYSEEAWFKTNTTSGGKIIGFGSSASGLSAGYDRHVYMQNDGKVVFGAHTCVQNVVIRTDAFARTVANAGLRRTSVARGRRTGPRRCPRSQVRPVSSGWRPRVPGRRRT